jgi:subtilisin family serine protease
MSVYVHEGGADTSPFDGAGIVVAVLDTGIDATHPAFNGVNLIEKDFTGEGNGDTHGHGTHCAGTIFGRDVNGMRIGVARGVTKALIGKVLGNGGGGSENIVSAIQWALDEGAHVISMSLGMDFPGFQKRLEASGMKKEAATSLALEGYRLNIQLFDRLAAMVNALALFRQPCLLVAAAGNESGRGDAPPFEIAASPPAVSDGFIAVAALEQGTSGFGVATLSNTGAAVSAPGVGVVGAETQGRRHVQREAVRRSRAGVGRPDISRSVSHP